MPRPKPRSEKRAMIEASLGAIYAARDRGCTWAEIAEGLAEAGVVVTADALRFAVNERPRDLKAYPRTIEVRKLKRRPNRASADGAVKEISNGARVDVPADKAVKETKNGRVDVPADKAAKVRASENGRPAMAVQKEMHAARPAAPVQKEVHAAQRNAGRKT
jgi:hypothetical protein